MNHLAFGSLTNVVVDAVLEGNRRCEPATHRPRFAVGFMRFHRLLFCAMDDALHRERCPTGNVAVIPSAKGDSLSQGIVLPVAESD